VLLSQFAAENTGFAELFECFSAGSAGSAVQIATQLLAALDSGPLLASDPIKGYYQKKQTGSRWVSLQNIQQPQE
jgi:hypothetical protein